MTSEKNNPNKNRIIKCSQEALLVIDQMTNILRTKYIVASLLKQVILTIYHRKQGLPKAG